MQQQSHKMGTANLEVLNKLKGWIYSGVVTRSSHEFEQTYVNDDDDFDENWEHGVDEPDDWELVHVFFDLLNHHADKKESFFKIITKMMETDDPTSLDKNERQLMLGIINEAIFDIDVDGFHGQA